MFFKGTDLNFQNLPDIGVLHLGNGLSLDGGGLLRRSLRRVDSEPAPI